MKKVSKISIIFLSVVFMTSLFFACGPNGDDKPTDGGDAGDSGDVGASGKVPNPPKNAKLVLGDDPSSEVVFSWERPDTDQNHDDPTGYRVSYMVIPEDFQGEPTEDDIVEKEIDGADVLVFKLDNLGPNTGVAGVIFAKNDTGLSQSNPPGNDPLMVVTQAASSD